MLPGMDNYHRFKGTVISSDPSYKDGKARFPMVPLKDLYSDV